MTLSEKQRDRYHETLLDMRRQTIGSARHVFEAINEDSNTLANLSSVPVHLADVAQGGIVADEQVLENENGLIVGIDAALERISDGSYGICDVCGKSIPAERLQALPFATRCAACAAAEEVPRQQPR
jgi:RNA polymerase-binding transcription factor DksA